MPPGGRPPSYSVEAAEKKAAGGPREGIRSLHSDGHAILGWAGGFHRAPQFYNTKAFEKLQLAKLLDLLYLKVLAVFTTQDSGPKYQK